MLASKFTQNIIKNFKCLSNQASIRNASIRLQNTASNSAQSTDSSKNTGSETSFGFKRVKADEKQHKVNEVFSNVAQKYDLMNDAMSFGLHRLWKNTLINEIDPTKDMKLIDVAAGTGDITFRFLNYLKAKYGTLDALSDENRVTVCDINENMLNVGKHRAEEFGFNRHINWKVGNAESLSHEPDNAYDVYTIVFGIRNCTNIDRVVKEAYRVLKPGGRFLCMEFSRTKNPVFGKIYDMYSFQIIPVMGYLIAGDWNSYQYLVESIRMFPSQEEFATLISDCGFKLVDYKNLSNGAVAIHSGYKF